MKSISAVLICFNEEQKIERALRSVSPLADEIVVVDSFSQDATPQICRNYHSRFFQRHWNGYLDQKQFATAQARHDWVLSLDADEMLSPELAREIKDWKKKDEPFSGYYFPRKSYFLGRWITHTTWYPDWQLRLFKKSRGRWTGGRIHESFTVGGQTSRMRGDLHHYTYDTLSEYLVQLENFSALAAADYRDRGVKPRLHHLLVYPPAIFAKNYLLKLGFLDGVPGLAVSVFAGFSTFLKFLKLYELQLDPSLRRPPESTAAGGGDKTHQSR
ncbi:MAG: glycosyltransferase family 2 protein [Acidobacteria bacterium]|nr:glycosyltransferase family 2 protein [Acidobacteriota bacterium]